MSCVPWASWAAKKAAKLVGDSGGGTKTIDLLNYTVSTGNGESETLNYALLAAFQASLIKGTAFSLTVYPASEFFKDCDTDQQLRVKLTYTGNDDSVSQIYFEGITKMHYQGSLVNINITYNIYYNGNLVEAKCWIMPDAISIDAKVISTEGA